MEFSDMTYSGPPVDDTEVLELLPTDLRSMIEQENGFVAFRGGLHVRGACSGPSWHSLRNCWLGENSLAEKYPLVRHGDIPFGQDAFGDQFLLREAQVWRLLAETGDLEPLELTIAEFLSAAAADPFELLALMPLLEFEREGGALEPGQLLSVFPPFCMKSDSETRSYRAVTAEDRLAFLADLADQIANLRDGDAVSIQDLSHE